MFRPKRMQEVNLFVAEQDVAAVTRAIARLGLLHLLDVSHLGERLPLAHADRHELIRTFAGLERELDDFRQSLALGTPLVDLGVEPAPRTTVDELRNRTRRLHDEVDPVVDQIATVDEEVEYLEPLIRQLELLSPLDVAMEDLRTLDYLYLAVGSLPAANLERLRSSLVHLPSVILPFEEEDEHVAAFVFAAKDQAEVLDRALKSAYFQPFELPLEFSGPLDQVVAEMRQKTSQLAGEKEALHARLATLREDLSTEIEALVKRARIERVLHEAMEHFGQTGQVYLIAGWMPTDAVPSYLSSMDEATEGRAYAEARRPRELNLDERSVPTALSNPRLVRPFELITSIYGHPEYREIDPTPFVALTFFAMFGMMFGDAGHGLILSLTGAIIATGWVRSLRAFKSFAPILIACGLASMLFGFLYGTAFGVEGILPVLWLSPLHDILSLLIASIVFGVVAMNVGFIFHLLNAWRRGDWHALLLQTNGLAGFLLYWMLLLAVVSVAGVVSIGILPLVVVAGVAMLFIVLGEPLGNLLNGERPLLSTSPGAYAIQAFFELFEAVVAFLSNSLSYVRLGAFAVAHVGLTSIVFILADLFGGVAPLRWLIVVLGTIAIVAFEGLIVGIQTLRLEYYEFFSKFFGGAGIPYRPLHLPEA